MTEINQTEYDKVRETARGFSEALERGGKSLERKRLEQASILNFDSIRRYCEEHKKDGIGPFHDD